MQGNLALDFLLGLGLGYLSSMFGITGGVIAVPAGASKRLPGLRFYSGLFFLNFLRALAMVFIASPAPTTARIFIACPWSEE